MQRRKLDFHDFDAPGREADRLLRDGYHKAGNWDLTLTCEHLAVVMEGSLDGFTFPPASWFWRRLLGPVLVRVVLWTRWIKQGVSCPDPSFCPLGKSGAAEAVERFKRAFQRVRDRTGEFVPHPILGRLTPEQWRQVHLIHAAHHFSFLIPNEERAGALAAVGANHGRAVSEECRETALE